MKKTGNEKLQTFLTDHLNKIYCAKAHMVERLPEILDHVKFTDLKDAIKETIAQMEKQVAEMDKIYSLLHSNYSFSNCSNLIIGLDNAFIAVQSQSDDADLRDLLIIAYMNLVEGMEIASFQILLTASHRIMAADVKLLLIKGFEATKADRSLLQLVSAKLS